jgi:succinate dehydrogenase/fumarate reductase flavoprotein subunit
MEGWKISLGFLVAACLSVPFPDHSQAQPVRTLNGDVAVIGAGASGLIAGLTAAEGGARVVIFEKMPFPGGTSNFPGGIFAVESEMQRRRNINLSRDQAFKMIMEYSHWRADARLVRAFVDRSAGTIDWLQKLGVEFLEPAAIYPGGPQTWHLLKGRGAAMIRILVTRAKERGIEILLATPVKEILKDEEGRIAGVTAQAKEGGMVKALAPAVIIATGGYANDPGMIRKYAGFELEKDLFPAGNVGKTGDGIKMAWELGAAPEGLGVLQLTGGSPVGPGIRQGEHLAAASTQPYLWINQAGVRFCDESVAYNFTFAGNAAVRQDGRLVFRIFDEATKKYLVGKGIDVGLGIFVPPATRLIHLDREIKEALEKGNPNIYVGDSLEELARKMGTNPHTFKKTVEEYNRFCEKNHDDLFAKDPKFLHPVKTPRFYGFKCYPSFLGTLGGIRINEKTEVLNAAGRVIPGLYAVGLDAGGMYGDSYHLILPGSTLGFAVNSGRMAGENALNYIRIR